MPKDCRVKDTLIPFPQFENLLELVYQFKYFLLPYIDH